MFGRSFIKKSGGVSQQHFSVSRMVGKMMEKKNMTLATEAWWNSRVSRGDMRHSMLKFRSSGVRSTGTQGILGGR